MNSPGELAAGFCLVLALCAAGAAPARADAPNRAAESDLFASRPWVLAFHLAIAAPAGSLATELEREIGGGVSAGIGAGHATGGVQWAGMLRLRLPLRRDIAIGAGAGASHGDYEQWDVWDDPAIWQDVTWANGELFVDNRTAIGFSARVYLGYSLVLAGGRFRGDPEIDDEEELPGKLPYAGVALGVTF
jgi:hypothetical protein